MGEPRTDAYHLLGGPGVGDSPGSKCTSTMARTELPGPKSRRRTLRKSFLTSEFRKRSSSCGWAVVRALGSCPGQAVRPSLSSASLGLSWGGEASGWAGLHPCPVGPARTVLSMLLAVSPKSSDLGSAISGV